MFEEGGGRNSRILFSVAESPRNMKSACDSESLGMKREQGLPDGSCQGEEGEERFQFRVDEKEKKGNSEEKAHEECDLFRKRSLRTWEDKAASL